MRRLPLATLLFALTPIALAQPCGGSGVGLQVLGSGGPELQAKRAATSYLLWIDGKARVLVDAGGASALRFGESGAQMRDLDVLLFTRLNADHSASLPTLIQSSWFENRTRPLPIYGPAGDRQMPSTVAFVRDLFDGTRGAWRNLGEFLSPLDRSSYKIEPRDVREPPAKIAAPRRKDAPVLPVFANERVRVSALVAPPGAAPGLAFRIEAGGKTLAFSGDTGSDDALATLALGADLLIAHAAIAENAGEPQRAQHMLPSAIGTMAQVARVKQLVLTHRTPATLGREEETLAAIRKNYTGPVHFADDLSCFPP